MFLQLQTMQKNCFKYLKAKMYFIAEEIELLKCVYNNKTR